MTVAIQNQDFSFQTYLREMVYPKKLGITPNHLYRISHHSLEEYRKEFWISISKLTALSSASFIAYNEIAAEPHYFNYTLMLGFGFYHISSRLLQDYFKLKKETNSPNITVNPLTKEELINAQKTAKGSLKNLTLSIVFFMLSIAIFYSKKKLILNNPAEVRWTSRATTLFTILPMTLSVIVFMNNYWKYQHARNLLKAQ
jgi:hypothetical protein